MLHGWGKLIHSSIIISAFVDLITHPVAHLAYFNSRDFYGHIIFA